LKKIPILIIGHGDLPVALINSAQMLMGERDEIYSLCLHEGDGLENFIQKAGELIASIKGTTPLLVFVDLQGGTPWNSVLGVNDPRVRLVTGINLPMLLEVLNLRDACEDVDQLVECALETGRKSVVYKKFPL
jgi:mannose/fructose/sorbose-specific phosphotransferase system IIA component